MLRIKPLLCSFLCFSNLIPHSSFFSFLFLLSLKSSSKHAFFKDLFPFLQIFPLLVVNLRFLTLNWADNDNLLTLAYLSRPLFLFRGRLQGFLSSVGYAVPNTYRSGKLSRMPYFYARYTIIHASILISLFMLIYAIEVCVSLHLHWSYSFEICI